MYFCLQQMGYKIAVSILVESLMVFSINGTSQLSQIKLIRRSAYEAEKVLLVTKLAPRIAEPSKSEARLIAKEGYQLRRWLENRRTLSKPVDSQERKQAVEPAMDGDYAGRPFMDGRTRRTAQEPKTAGKGRKISTDVK